MHRQFVAIIICLSAATMLLAQEAPKDPQAQLTSALAQKINQLGVCNAELGPLQQLQAAVVNKQLVNPDETRKTLIAAIEQANPGKTVDASNKIVDTTKAKKD